jgi:hypothetical protein
MIFGYDQEVIVSLAREVLQARHQLGAAHVPNACSATNHC